MHKLIQRLLTIVVMGGTTFAFAGKGGGTVILPKPSTARPASAEVVSN